MHRSMIVIAGTVASMVSGAYAQCGSAAPARVAAATHVSEGPDIVATAQSAGMFSTLLAAAKAAGLVEALSSSGPLTVFAPTDEAFAKLPKGTVESLLKPENREALATILKFHVVPMALPARDVTRLAGVETLSGQRVEFALTEAGGVRVNGANVTKADIECSNGVIHVIDSVILPEMGSIVDVASGAGTFKTLLAAAQAAGLAEALAGPGPFTVLAPSDEAFAKLPKGTVESLLKPENKAKLVEILSYHVIAGRVSASEAVAAGRAETLAGPKVAFDIAGGCLRVDGATIVATDIDASNGVIHVIDRVIMP